MPRGSPTTTQMMEAATTSDIVSIAVCQKPNSARYASEAPTKIATRVLAIRWATKSSTAMVMGQGVPTKTDVMALSITRRNWVIPSNRNP